jgi:hypothetical protein
MDFIFDIEMVTMPLLIAVCVGLGELYKIMGVNPKVVPLINIAMGVLACLFLFPGIGLPLRVFNGLIVALSASGAFSFIKNYREK